MHRVLLEPWRYAEWFVTNSLSIKKARRFGQLVNRYINSWRHVFLPFLKKQRL